MERIYGTLSGKIKSNTKKYLNSDEPRKIDD